MSRIIEVDGSKFLPSRTLTTVNTMSAMGMASDNAEDRAAQLIEADRFLQVSARRIGRNSPTLGEGYNVANLKDEWPPEPEVIASLTKVTSMLRQVEAKTGVTFRREVGLTPGDTGLFMLDNMHSVHMDYSAATGKFPPYEHLKNIMLHESSHAFHEDNAKAARLNAAVVILESAAQPFDLYQYDKPTFEKLLTHQFKNLDEFEATYKGVSKGADDYLAPLTASVPGALKMKPDAILGDMYSQRKIETALKLIPPLPDEELKQSIGKLSAAFPVPTREQMRIGRKNLEYIAQRDAEKGKTGGMMQPGFAMSPEGYDALIKNGIDFFTSGESNFTLSDADRARVDRVVKETMAPMVAHAEEIKGFARRYSVAFERRADDFMVAHADDPHSVPETLAMLDKIDSGKYAELSQIQWQEPDHNEHDLLDARIARSKKMADFTTRVREVAGKDADVMAALYASSRANQQKGKAAKRGDIPPFP